jgi:hypothetical protein
MQRPIYCPRYSSDLTAEKSSSKDNTCETNISSQKMNGHVGNEHWTSHSSPRSKVNATTENAFDYDTKAPKKETLEHPGVAPGGSSNVSVSNALKGVEFIAQHIKNADKDTEVIEDWKYIAMVLDRLFLWLFTLACIMGTGGIILRAPSLYDMREPIDAKLSEIPKFII